MDEAWERAVEAALEGQAGDSSSAPRTLTLDGAVKCLHGRLPPPVLLERYQTLEHLSIANVGVSSLEKFPHLRNLQRLILSDNRIAGGLEFLVEAGLDSLRDLDLSNNRIQSLDDLTPLSRLRLVSLDLYECPVTRIRDYRSRVFAMIRSLKYLDKMDADENERPESDDEDDEEDEEEEEEEDPGCGEIDGEDRSAKVANGVVNGSIVEGIVDVDEDEESDADEEETVRPEANGSHQHRSNGFRVVQVGGDEEDVEDEDVDDDGEEDDDDEDDDGDPGEEIDEEDGEDEDVVEVHDVADSDEDGDGVEVEEEDVDEEDDDEVDGDGDEDEEDVEDEEEDGDLGSTARLTSTDGEIDGHDQGEEDENGEIGEEDEEGVEEEPDFEEDDGDGEDEEEDLGGDYLVQHHIVQAEEVEAGGSDLDACNGEDEDGVDDDNEDDAHHHVQSNGPSSSLRVNKRKRDGGDDVDDDNVEDLRSPKHP